ncbi:MAG: MFS transporter [Lentisphaerota bacterium]
MKFNKTPVVILLTSIVFLLCSANDIYISSLPQMVVDFKTTPNVINLTLSMYALGTAVFVLFADLASSRYGRKPVIITALGIFTLASLLISISASIWLIIALRIVQSMGLGFIMTTSTLILKDSMDEREQIKALGIMLTGLVLSPAISPVIGAYLAHHFGWRSCFVFSTILGIILLGFTIKILPETISLKLTQLPNLGIYIKKYFMVLGDKVFLYLTILFACGAGAYYAFIGISSYLFINNLGITPIMYSYIYIFMAAAFLAGNQYLLVLNKNKASYNKILGIGVFGTLAGSAIILLAEGISNNLLIAVLITLGAILMRAANALVNPTVQVITVNRFKKRGGIALGMAMSVGIGGQGVAVILVTLFHDNPLAGLIIISLALSIIGVVVFYLVKRLLHIEHSLPEK